MFSDAHMNSKFICKMGMGLYFSVANVIAFSIVVIEITYCNLIGKKRSVITVLCFSMR